MRVQPLLNEPVAIGFGLPHVDIAKPALSTSMRGRYLSSDRKSYGKVVVDIGDHQK